MTTIKFLQIHISRQLIILFSIISCCISSTALAQKKNKAGKSGSAAITVDLKKEINQKDSYKTFLEGMPGGADSGIVRIPFEYKQSALYHRYTLDVIDSVIGILQSKPAITLSIDGYAHIDEGTDTICKWLSYNRALFVRDYVLGRGIDSSRILEVIAYGNTRPFYKGADNKGMILNCRAELRLNYPKPIVKLVVPDTDEDGLIDTEDKCPLEFGIKENGGCPNKNVVLVPFETQQAILQSMTYQVLDSVISILKQNPSFTISIEGHAYKEEGTVSICNFIAKERAEIVKNYLYSRMIPLSRIDTVKSWGIEHPLNAGKNSQEVFLNSRVEISFNRHQSL